MDTLTTSELRASLAEFERDIPRATLAAAQMASSVATMMHGIRGYFRFAHIDGPIPATTCPGCAPWTRSPEG